MNQQQTSKKGQNRTPVAASSTSTKKGQSETTPQSQIRRTTATPNRSQARPAAPASSGIATPLLAGGIIAAIVVLGIIITAIVVPALGPASNDVAMGVEKTYSVSGAGDHKDTRIDYGSVSPYVIPPVGGPHNQWWQNCGVYTEQIPTESGVHSMEHGAVWITYQPDLDPGAVATLQGIAKQSNKVLLSPYAGISAPIIASAWGGQGNTGYQIRLKAGQYTELNKFVQKHAGAADAPEPSSACTGGQGNPLP